MTTRQKIEKDMREENELKLRDECSRLAKGNSVSRFVNQSPLADSNLNDVVVENEYETCIPQKQEDLSYDHIDFKENS